MEEQSSGEEAELLQVSGRCCRAASTWPCDPHLHISRGGVSNCLGRGHFDGDKKEKRKAAVC